MILPRFKLRTLLILLAVLPPLLAAGWLRYSAWRVVQERRAELSRIKLDILVDVIWMDELAGVKFDTAAEPKPLAARAGMPHRELAGLSCMPAITIGEHPGEHLRGR